MSSFEVLVRTIADVVDHPNADRLSIVTVLGYNAITAKNEDGSHRFQPGDKIVYVPEGAVVPEHLLKQQGYWNEEKDCGMLAGKKGDRVKPIRLRGIFSQGLIWSLNEQGSVEYFYDDSTQVVRAVSVGDDVADFFGITKYEPPVPTGMGGEVIGATEFSYGYDIENFQTFPDFLVGEEVEATEKLHGTCFRISYRPNTNYPELFGDGDVAIASKGLGAKGLVFKNTEQNAKGNLYVRTALELGLVDKVRALGLQYGKPVDLFGEIFGVGVQDLHYGTSKPEFRAFDLRIDGQFLAGYDKDLLFADLGVTRVPVLYVGPFDLEVLTELRDGASILGGSIREGIVVTAFGDQTPRQADQWHTLRPTLKMVSPDYLTRKGGTEFN